MHWLIYSLALVEVLDSATLTIAIIRTKLSFEEYVARNRSDKAWLLLNVLQLRCIIQNACSRAAC